MKRKLQKIEAHFCVLFRKDGWCLMSRWGGWFPEFYRGKGSFYREYQLRIGPMQLTIQTTR